MKKAISGAASLKAIQLSPEISKEKIKKTKLGEDITKMSTVHTTTYGETAYIPKPQKNFMKRCKPKGKVFNQVRIGYIFSCFKYKKINSEAAKFFNVNTHIIEQYCRSITHINNHIQQFSKADIMIFEEEADKDLKLAYNKLKEFKSTSTLNQLRNHRKIPIIGLLEKQNKLNGINKFNDYGNIRDIKSSEHNLKAISKRKSDKQTVLYNGSTHIPETKRKLKSNLPSLWLAFNVLNMLCNIHNRKALNVMEKRTERRISKQQTKQHIIQLHIEGMPNIEIIKLVDAGRTKIAEIVREFKRSEIVKTGVIINKNSIIATENTKNDPPNSLMVGNVKFISAKRKRKWAA